MNPNDIFDHQRYGLITGSKCKVLFPKRSAEVGQRQYAKELANQMFWKYYDDKGTWQTEHGHFAESSAFEYYQLHFDKSAEYTPKFATKENIWGGSADCLSQDKGIDFKCPTSLEAWLDYLHEGIDEQQYHQAQMYMFLYDRPKWSVCAFLLETNRMSENGVTYPVPYDQRMIECKVTKESGWEDKLREVSPGLIEKRNEFFKGLIETFGEPINKLNQ